MTAGGWIFTAPINAAIAIQNRTDRDSSTGADGWVKPFRRKYRSSRMAKAMPKQACSVCPALRRQRPSRSEPSCSESRKIPWSIPPLRVGDRHKERPEARATGSGKGMRLRVAPDATEISHCRRDGHRGQGLFKAD